MVADDTIDSRQELEGPRASQVTSENSVHPDRLCSAMF